MEAKSQINFNPPTKISDIKSFRFTAHNLVEMETDAGTGTRVLPILETNKTSSYTNPFYGVPQTDLIYTILKGAFPTLVEKFKERKKNKNA